MGRPQAFSEEQMVESAAALVSERGPQAFTMEALGDAIGAPTGSIYYRFSSRDVLLAAVWLGEVERFQARWNAEAVRCRSVGELARVTVAYARRHRARARVLMLHRSDEFLGRDIPPPIRARAERLNAKVPSVLRALSTRWSGSARSKQVAVIDIPLAAVRPYLERDDPIPAWIERAASVAAEAAWNEGSGQ